MKEWNHFGNVGKIVILFPGSFKPFHIGHLILLHKYIKYAREKYENAPIEVKIIISKKDREFVTAESTLNFIENIKKYLNSDYTKWYNQQTQQFENYENVLVDCYISDEDSPIQECYHIVFESHAKDVKFMLVTSNKSYDLSRQTDMINKFNYCGKYFIGFNRILKVPKNVVAQINKNGRNLNATYLRDCVRLNAKNGFVESYGNNFDTTVIEKYFETLKALNHEEI